MNAASITIRPLQKADIPGAMQLKTAENWNQTEEDWHLLLEHDPNLCFVASCDDKVVGTVTATNYDNDIAWIGMMLVDKDFRGLGLGKRLLTTSVESLRECKSIMLDATDKGLPMYRKLGFQEERMIDRMVATNLNGTLPEEEDNYIKLLAGAALDEVASLDQEAFGANRLRLITGFLTKNGDKAWYIEKERELAGYVFGRPGSNYFQLGPLSAKTEQEAELLVKTVLRNYIGRPVLVDIFQDKASLKALLSSLGFVVQRSFTRMYLKHNPHPVSRQNYYLIAGPELG